MEEYESDMEKIGSHYWSIAESEQVVGVLSEEKRELWRRWLDAGPNLRERIERTNSWIKIVNGWATQERQWMRKSNKEINDILVKRRELQDIFSGANIRILRAAQDRTKIWKVRLADVRPVPKSLKYRLLAEHGKAKPTAGAR